MIVTRIGLATSLLLASVPTLHAQPAVIAQLSPADITDAIRVGQQDRVPSSTLRGEVTWSSGAPDVLGVFTTPFIRVAAAARLAHLNYATFAPDDIAPSALAPELHVHAYPQQITAGIANVTQVVITPRKGRPEQKRAAAIMPLRVEPLPLEFKNLFGAVFEGDGLLAVFPIEAFSEDNEVHVVYDTPAFGCTDCRARFRLGPANRRVR